MEPRQRLHPLTPLVRSAKFLAVAIAGVSWQGLDDLGVGPWLLSMVGVLVIGAVVSLISWAVTGYQLVGRELRVYEGLLFRRNRTIPLERVQAIDVVRPFIARLLGLAELRLEVMGASKTEAPLAYLSAGDAARLRQRLVALVASRPADEAAPVPAEHPVHAIDNRNLLIGQLLTPQTLTLPIGLVFVVGPALIDPVWTFIGAASTLTAFVGIFQVPVRRVLDDWGFRIATDATGLRLRHGLLGTRSHTVPPARVQAVKITWPLLWRLKRWARVRMDVAGYGGGEAAEKMRAGMLLPVAAPDTTRSVSAFALGGAVHGTLDGPPVDPLTLPTTPPPRRARWLAPFAQPRIGFGVTDEVVTAREGVLTRELVAVPLARVQSVRVVQGPIQRRLRLASVHVDTAGGLHAVGRHRDVLEAYVLAGELAARSRAARARATAARADAAGGDGGESSTSAPRSTEAVPEWLG